MPCNRRMNRCGGPRFHPYGGRGLHHHPLFATMMMMNDVLNHSNEEEEVEEEQVVASLFGKDKARWNETGSNFVFQMDVPGVKGHHVTIEEKEGEIEVTAIRVNGQEVIQTYQDVFYVNPTKADLSNVVATLDDGVLTIVVPKKKNPEPWEVPVLQGAAPKTDGQEFRFSLDLPGVKVTNLKVEVRDDKVYVQANRKVGERTMTFRRVIEVESSKTNMGKAQGYLQDGVFTMVAPVAQEDMDDSPKPGAVRIIEIQEEIAGLEGLSLDENEKKEDGEMVVETVTEGDQDWEEVNKSKMEKANDKQN